MARLSLDELMTVLLDNAPLTEERGFEGPGTYLTCLVCGLAVRWPDPLVHVSSRLEVTLTPIIDFEAALANHLAGHDRMEIYGVLARLVEEARAGRVFRRRVEAVLAG